MARVNVGPKTLTVKQLRVLNSQEIQQYLQEKRQQKGDQWVQDRIDAYELSSYKHIRDHCKCCQCGYNCKPCFTKERKQAMLDLLWKFMIKERDHESSVEYAEQFLALSQANFHPPCPPQI